MTAAVIIARGGSIRLPRKNVLPLCGLPLVAWSVIQATCSHLIDHTFLSTDDDEIEDIGREYGAEIIRRPDWPDADQVAANRVYLHAISEIEARRYDMDRMVCMFPTSPLRYPNDLDRGVAHHNRTGWHVSPMAINREVMLYKNLAGVFAELMVWDKHKFYLNGNSGLFNIVETEWYKWFVTNLTEKAGDLDEALDDVAEAIGENPDPATYFTICEKWQCTELDTMSEFELGEVLMEHFILQGRGPGVYYEYGRTK